MRLFAAIAVLTLGACDSTPLAWLPPDEFIHPFAGALVVHDMPYRGGSLIAKSRWRVGSGRCDVYLPLEPDLRRVSYVIEVANCNSAIDVNGGVAMSFAERLAYSRAWGDDPQCGNVPSGYRRRGAGAAAPDQRAQGAVKTGSGGLVWF